MGIQSNFAILKRNPGRSAINSFIMDANVKYDGFDIPVENVETVGELKEKLRETDGTNFKEFDFDEWNLYQGEKELDDPKMLLVELAQGGEGITLVKPDEKQKGKEKSRSIYTDKTRDERTGRQSLQLGHRQAILG